MTTADLIRRLAGMLAALLLFIGGLLITLIGEVTAHDWLPRTGWAVAVIGLVGAAVLAAQSLPDRNRV